MSHICLERHRGNETNDLFMLRLNPFESAQYQTLGQGHEDGKGKGATAGAEADRQWWTA